MLDRRGVTIIELMVTMGIFVLIMAATYMFFIGISRGASVTRQTAFGGQAAERAIERLRTELAGARQIDIDANGNLVYQRVRDGQDSDVWALQLIDNNLVRTQGEEVEVLARHIHEFEFELPTLENPYLIVVRVRSGKVRLQENIFLRNYY